MRWKIQYTKNALEDLSVLDLKTAQKIVLKIKYFVEQKNPPRFAQKLKSPFGDLYRFRIGDYRAIFEVEAKKEIRLLFILRIKHRKDVYK